MVCGFAPAFVTYHSLVHNWPCFWMSSVRSLYARLTPASAAPGEASVSAQRLVLFPCDGNKRLTLSGLYFNTCTLAPAAMVKLAVHDAFTACPDVFHAHITFPRLLQLQLCFPVLWNSSTSLLDTMDLLHSPCTNIRQRKLNTALYC